jgi:branched-chain amino acid transport system substrate-binding protein
LGGTKFADYSSTAQSWRQDFALHQVGGGAVLNGDQMEPKGNLALAAILTLAIFASPAAHAADNPIKIGASLSLTTDFALAGIQQKGGIDLAVEEINAAGGVPGKGGNRKVEVVYGDNAMSPAIAINSLNRILSDNPVAVMLSVRGTHVLPQMPLLQKSKVPGLTISGVKRITQLNNPYIFRFSPHDGMNKPVLIKYIVEKLGKKRVAIFHSAEDFGMSGRDEAIASLKKLGLEPVAVESHQPTDKDFSAQLEKFRDAKADVIFLQTFQAPSALILKQAHQIGLNIPFALGSQSVALSGLKLLDASDIEGFYAEAPMVDPIFSTVPAIEKWSQNFEKRFGFVGDSQALADYDATNMLLKVIQTYGVDPADITTGLHKLKYQGLAGTYQSDAEGNSAHDVSVVQIRDLKQIEMERVSVPF